MYNKKILVVVFLFLCSVSIGSNTCISINWNDQVRQADCFNTREGDSLYWADPLYDDSGWEVLRQRSDFWIRNHAQKTGTRWYRMPVFLSDDINEIRFQKSSLLLYVASSADAAEFYWNGKKIAVNGILDKQGNVIQFGTTSFLFTIPDSLVSSGKHLLAIRQSSKLPGSGYLSGVFLGKDRNVFFYLHRQLALVVVLCGGFWVAAAFHLAHFFTRFHRSPMRFAFMCGGAGILMMTPLIAVYANISYAQAPVIFSVSVFGWIMMCISGLLYIMDEYSDLTGKFKWVLSLVLFIPMLLLWTIPFGYLPAQVARLVWIANEISLACILLVCLGVCLYAIYKKQTGALVVTIGMLFLIVNIVLFFFKAPAWTWGVGLMGLVLFLSLAQYLQFGSKKKTMKDSELLQARLEIELLKKSIQPRFLLNSLRSVSNWLEKDPLTASKLVNALATELRSMLRLVREKLISLEEELGICRSHLELMSMRLGCGHSLTVEGVDGNELVPPMIFYSLLDYGIDPKSPECHPAVFKVTKKKSTRKETYTMRIRSEILKNQQAFDETGLLYVKARLREAFPSTYKVAMEQDREDLVFHIEVFR